MGKLLQNVLRNWPAGTVAVQPWLARQQVTKQLTQHYLKSGWIQKIGQGAYIKLGDQVDWRGGGVRLTARACNPTPCWG